MISITKDSNGSFYKTCCKVFYDLINLPNFCLLLFD